MSYLGDREEDLQFLRHRLKGLEDRLESSKRRIAHDEQEICALKEKIAEAERYLREMKVIP